MIFQLRKIKPIKINRLDIKIYIKCSLSRINLDEEMILIDNGNNTLCVKKALNCLYKYNAIYFERQLFLTIKECFYK